MLFLLMFYFPNQNKLETPERNTVSNWKDLFFSYSKVRILIIKKKKKCRAGHNLKSTFKPGKPAQECFRF